MLKVGIVGLPNVGKSTLFNAILKREQALSANYPFATIDPNVGIVDVVDKRLDKLQKLVAVDEMGAPDEILNQVQDDVNMDDIDLPPIKYANIEFVDIAGLVKGASKGEGLGNQFLANIREVDMILHVVRDFSDENVVRDHSKNPEHDAEVINSELILKDIESLEKKLNDIGNDHEKGQEREVLNKYIEHLNSGGFAYDLNPKNPTSEFGNTSVELISEKIYKELIEPLFLITDKEMVYVLNVDEDDEKLKSQNLKVKNKEFKNRPVLYISAKLEAELSSLGEADQKAYLKELGIDEPGLDKITRICFEKLGLISFFTAGEKEVRAWEVEKGTNAKKAAGTIHTDFEKNFVKAEVVSYKDYVEHGSKLAAKNAGKLRVEGKDYIVKDGDVIEFKVNV